MTTELQYLNILSTNLAYLKSKSTLKDKCLVLLETVRKSGWRRASLSFIDNKFKTVNVFFSGYNSTERKHFERNIISAGKRMELLSATVDKYRHGVFYYLPWREERARDIISDGMRTDIPIELDKVWNTHDMLYAPIYYNAYPVAVFALDSPFSGEVPNALNLRIPSMIHAILIEIIRQYVSIENSPHYQLLQHCIIGKGNIGIIEMDDNERIRQINGVAEIMLGLEFRKALNMHYTKAFDQKLLSEFIAGYREAQQTLEAVTVNIKFMDKHSITRNLRLDYFPIHVLYSYRGMICIFDYPENADVYKTYVNVMRKIDTLKASLVGDARVIQAKLIRWLRENYGFKYPRVYQVSEDQENLICKVFWDKNIKDTAFFNHTFNRNSLPSIALLEKKVLYTTDQDKYIRDVRRIWVALKTKGAIAIPLNLHEPLPVVLVCDFDTSIFTMNRSQEIIFSFFGSLLGTTLKILNQIDYKKGEI